MDTERRHSRRQRVSLAIEYETATRRRVEQSHDLSTAGLSLEMDEAPPIGSEIRISFTLPGSGTRVEALGAVVWGQTDGTRARIGIRFNRFLHGYIELGDYLLGL